MANEHTVRFVTKGESDWMTPFYADGRHIANFAKANGIENYRVVRNETLCTGVVFLLLLEVDTVEQALERMKATILNSGRNPHPQEEVAISEAIERYVEEVNKPINKKIDGIERHIDKLLERCNQLENEKERLNFTIGRYDGFLNEIHEKAKLDWTGNSLVMKINVFKQNLLANQN